jgi:2-methylcitrate dehydratase PrpD
MKKIEFVHGGEKYDSKYPKGIPTNIVLETKDNNYDSGLVMFPSGHSHNKKADLNGILENKFK